MKKKWMWSIIPIVVIVVAIGGIFGYALKKAGNQREDQMDQPVQENEMENSDASVVQTTGTWDYHTKILEEKDSMKAYNEVRPSIVKIDMGDSSGSGVILDINDEKMLIVSSKHLLEDFESGVVDFANGGVTIGWVVGLSETYDVGFMECYVEDIAPDDLKKCKQATYDLKRMDTLQVDEPIFQVGSLAGVASDYYEGSISSLSWYFEEFDSYMLYNYCKAVPGMSGGGTFTTDGYFIGLISGSYMEESCSLPLGSILEAMEEIVK